VFATSPNFHPSLTFGGKAGAYLKNPLQNLIVMVGFKKTRMKVNGRGKHDSFYDMATIIAVKVL